MDAYQGASQLKPKISKVILQRTVIGVIIVVVMNGALFAFAKFGGTDLLDMFEVAIDMNQIMLYGIIGAFGLAVILIGLGVLSVQGKVWNFYGDRVIIGNMTILYQNMIKVIVEEQDILAKAFDYGTMKIEATGTMPDQFRLEFVAKPGLVAQNVQAAVNRYRGYAQAQVEQANRVNKIVNQY